jgi:group I intron endonuclease
MQKKRRIICGIYKITSPTKKIYIGQSVDIEKRWWNYRGLNCKAQTRLYRSLKKHGIKKHKFEILQECKREELNDLEKYYVDLYQCFNSKYGLNLLDGGGSKATCSDETKKKISNANKNRPPHPNSIKNLLKAQAVRKQMFLNGHKFIPGNKGMPSSLETRKKQSIAAIKRGGHKSIMIPISMYDSNENFIKDFDNIRQAAIFIGNAKLASNITKCCDGIRKKCHNHIWKYKNKLTLW